MLSTCIFKFTQVGILLAMPTEAKEGLRFPLSGVTGVDRPVSLGIQPMSPRRAAGVLNR